MIDKEILLDILDIIYEYNNAPSIDDIKDELKISDYDLDKAISILYSYNVIGFEDDYLIPKMEYEKAEILIENIDYAGV